MMTPWQSIRSHRHRMRLRRRDEYEALTGRRCYFSGTDHTDLSNVRQVWYHALDTLRPVLGVAVVDLFSDCRQEHLPEAARHGLGLLTPASGPQTRVWVDLGDPEMFGAIRAFGIESISCFAYLATDSDRGRAPAGTHEVAYNHDSGSSVILELSDEEHAELTRRLELTGMLAENVLFASQL